MKWASWVACSVVLISVAGAQETPILQPYVNEILRARLVAVVAYPESEPVDNPQENQRARIDAQTAILKWGRYQVTQDTTVADLIVVVRKGRARATTIDSKNPSGVILYPSDSGINIHVHRGQDPPLSRTDPPQGNSHPRLGTQVGSTEDLLEVYLGRTPPVDEASRNPTQYPVDEPPVWFYTAKDALKAPKVEAVAKFREAVQAAEKKKP